MDTQKVCSRCGHKAEDEDVYCGQCGAKLASNEVKTLPLEEKDN